jgi:DNA-binding transcriptional MerR regulator/pimeloyl-ACP methyl ester carboxylesterase
MFGIGEFARRSRLSPKALRRYDELDLLPPDRVDPSTGYRWYARSQLAQARLVAELRQIGMPLADIKAALSVGAEARTRRVEVWWADAEADFAARRELAQFLIGKLNGKGPAMNMEDVKTRSVPERNVVTLLRHVHWAEYAAVSREFFDVFRQSDVPRLGGPDGAPFVVFHGDVTEDSDGPVEWCRPVPPSVTAAALSGLALPGLELRTEPAHEEAYVHLARDGAKTPPAQSLLVYEVLLAWAAEKHRRASGSVRQVFSGPAPVVAGPGLECDFAVPLAADTAPPDVVSGSAASDGCSLYYERRGEGPALLLIVGGGGDCGYYSAMADILASSYTVVTYDRRGNSRSVLSGLAGPLVMAQQSADAMAVLGACGLSSAAVFGNSGGATIALDLAARYPSVFPVVVSHEPPLPDESMRREFEEILGVLDTDGWRAAFTLLQTRMGGASPEETAMLLDPPSGLPPSPELDLLTRLSGNWEYMMTHEIAGFIGYQPDYDAIRAGGSRVVLAAGSESDPRERQIIDGVAVRLGSVTALFPGGHTAPEELPPAFAARLREVLLPSAKSLTSRVEAASPPGVNPDAGAGRQAGQIR